MTHGCKNHTLTLSSVPIDAKCEPNISEPSGGLCYRGSRSLTGLSTAMCPEAAMTEHRARAVSSHPGAAPGSVPHEIPTGTGALSPAEDGASRNQARDGQSAAAQDLRP